VTFNTGNNLTYPEETRFFRDPESPLHRQYEALRAFFVEELPGPQVARRFGYSPNALRVLCYQFRHDPHKRSSFFQHPRPGPRQAPLRDRVRQSAIGLRKKNLSIYDIQRELALAGHAISINALAVLMREEGFARLPRRHDEERPPTLKPEAAAVANIHELDLSPRSFRTDFGGLVLDQGLALFAGLNVIPKRSYPAAYSSGIGQRTNRRLMQTWFEHVGHAGLPRGDSLDLDFHTVPANTLEEPLEKHYLSRRSRSQQGILTFLARDAVQRVLCYARAGILKAEQASEIVRCVDFWQQQTGAAPQE